jgi:hypothetical protein
MFQQAMGLPDMGLPDDIEAGPDYVNDRLKLRENQRFEIAMTV